MAMECLLGAAEGLEREGPLAQTPTQAQVPRLWVHELPCCPWDSGCSLCFQSFNCYFPRTISRTPPVVHLGTSCFLAVSENVICGASVHQGSARVSTRLPCVGHVGLDTCPVSSWSPGIDRAVGHRTPAQSPPYLPPKGGRPVF